MGYWGAIVAAASSVLSSLMKSSGGGGGDVYKRTPSAANDPNQALDLKNYLDKIYGQSMVDPAPNDFRVRMGDVELPISLGTIRRQRILNLAAAPNATMSNFINASAPVGVQGTQGNIFDKLLPIAAMMGKSGGGSSSSNTDSSVLNHETSQDAGNWSESVY